MSDCYVGEIRLFAGRRAPVGWHFCDGTSLKISEYEVLFSLLSTNFGGDGVSTFALPDLRGRVPVHFGTNPDSQTVAPIAFAQALGQEQVAVTAANLPPHSHSLTAVASTGTATNATQLVTAAFAGGTGVDTLYVTNPATPNPVSLGASSIGSTGGTVVQDNIMPATAMNYIIALSGIYPSRN
ncbi:phage tail protein [Rheinheimera mangrovi]|uniref:phage tail protein n=1 Tax=Rheinheimera mangrovi TaxID=2498451 RepID=UPI000F8E066C|nr:tail fiber protein [Rheinheimera mangrovi]